MFNLDKNKPPDIEGVKIKNYIDNQGANKSFIGGMIPTEF